MKEQHEGAVPKGSAQNRGHKDRPNLIGQSPDWATAMGPRFGNADSSASKWTRMEHAKHQDHPRRKPKWNESGMSGYQAESAKVISDIMVNFNQAAHIPALTEMCSKMLVLSAENNFEVSNPKKCI